jgi:hypothetical protein
VRRDEKRKEKTHRKNTYKLEENTGILTYSTYVRQKYWLCFLSTGIIFLVRGGRGMSKNNFFKLSKYHPRYTYKCEYIYSPHALLGEGGVGPVVRVYDIDGVLHRLQNPLLL